VRQFEAAFAAYTGAPHAVALNSCTAALHLSLLAAGVRPGQEVITTPLTFCATANVIVHCGARPVFADIDPLTWNLDPFEVDRRIGAATRAILPVDYAGRPADMLAFAAIARSAGLALIEDAAHCVEGVTDGEKVGTIADFTCFSFYATKNLTTGEGGMVTTRDARAADFIRRASLHGMSRDAWARYAPGGSAHYDVTMPGFKYNMMDIQAAIGLHQMAKLERFNARRQELAQRYATLLQAVPEVTPLGLVQDVQLLDFETAAARDAAMRAAQNWRFVAHVGAAKPRPVRLEVTFRSVVTGAPPDELLTTVRGQEWSLVVDGKIVPCPRYLVDVRGERTEAKP